MLIAKKEFDSEIAEMKVTVKTYKKKL